LILTNLYLDIWLIDNKKPSEIILFSKTILSPLDDEVYNYV